ncbi:MAG: WbqC family protein [Myxococcaceae bacterium]
MKLAIMQPYFLPYIGYFQLISAVDAFVVYDNIKYTKKGWMNRNRYLLNGEPEVFSIPLARAGDQLTVVERTLAADFDRAKLLARIEGAYRRAPYFAETFAWFRGVVEHPEPNLFRFLLHSLEKTCAHLGVKTPFVVSSTLNVDATLKAQDKVLALCNALGASHYINPIGGTALYAKEAFATQGVSLHFLQARPLEYAQFGGSFVPWLSILDVLMFNPLSAVQAWVSGHYELS